MKKFNYEVGRLGERIASEFLAKKGFRILERNFRTRFGEIDLIASKDGILVFLEVKLKIGEDFGASPEEMIDQDKIWQIEKTARSFLIENPQYEDRYTSLRIDAVCIVLSTGGEVKRIAHYENIGF